MRLFGVVAAASRAIGLSREAAAVLRSVDVSDEQKEAAARQLSVKLLVLFGSIIGRALASFFLPALMLILLDAPGVIVLDEVVAALESWTVILLSIAFIPLLMVRWR